MGGGGGGGGRALIVFPNCPPNGNPIGGWDRRGVFPTTPEKAGGGAGIWGVHEGEGPIQADIGGKLVPQGRC